MPLAPKKLSTQGLPPRQAMPKKSLVWLASYPKSGNTWTRIFLANYFLSKNKPVSINGIQGFALSDAASELYVKASGGELDPGHPTEHLKYRQKVLAQATSNGADINFLKTHNMNETVFGVPLAEPSLTRSAIYIARHPYDVAISYARHYGLENSKACQSISDSNNTTFGRGDQVKQFLGSWSDHVESWTKPGKFPVHLVKYEDLKKDPHEYFSRMLRFIGVTPDPARLEQAVRFSSFEQLQAQEAKEGFVEASSNSDKFFHSGKSEQWQGVLDDADLQTIRRANKKMMKRLGYW